MPTTKKKAAPAVKTKAKAKPVAKALAKVITPKAKAEPPKKAPAVAKGKAPAAKGKAEVKAAKAAPAKAAPAAKKGKSDAVKKVKSVLGKSLVIVESPAKARTIKKYLGSAYVVKASVGHVMDLPKSRLGVDVEKGFEPEYVVLKDKKKVISEIRDAAAMVEKIFLAPDPDREGEAIAWHIAEQVKDINPNIQRVLFNEITRKGITEALQNPTVLNTNKTDAQQARRILDRLVGYEISPLLWVKVRRGLSAGRVQSVAVRMICERDCAMDVRCASWPASTRRLLTCSWATLCSSTR